MLDHPYPSKKGPKFGKKILDHSEKFLDHPYPTKKGPKFGKKILDHSQKFLDHPDPTKKGPKFGKKILDRSEKCLDHSEKSWITLIQAQQPLISKLEVTKKNIPGNN